MRIAVISDLHGNLEAATELKDRIDDVDRIYCLGDAIGIGPDPAEVLAMLLDDKRVCRVMGNHEVNTRDMTEIGPLDFMPRKPHHDWVRNEIGDLAGCLDAPMMINEDFAGRQLTFLHRHPNDCGSKVPYYDHPFPEVLDEFYSDVPGDVIFFGHTHIPLFVIGKRGRLYINPGSVGAQNGGIGSFVIIDDLEGQGTGISRRRFRYDRDPVISRLKRKNVPYNSFIIRNFYSGQGFGPITVNDI